MLIRQTQYYSYLLRIWQSDEHDPFVWRASLESAFTGQQYSFATVTELFEFLEQLVAISTNLENRPHLEE